MCSTERIQTAFVVYLLNDYQMDFFSKSLKGEKNRTKCVDPKTCTNKKKLKKEDRLGRRNNNDVFLSLFSSFSLFINILYISLNNFFLFQKEFI